uniref:Protein-tyrosine-phosphatase n=1 Tax=Globisporangium ultimum (strain ATCC 200006 / CBS 805.95 / DAOM BR144) TaxID=431595 RepID=K3WAN1_GLOUD
MGNQQSSQDAFADVLPSTKKQVPPTTVVSKANGVSKDPIDNGESETIRPSSQAEEIPGAPAEVQTQISSASMRIQPPAHALLHDQLLVPTITATASTQEENETADRFLIPESVRKSRILDEFADVCSEIILESLYVSNVAVARDTKRLRALGITHVVNCCKELCIETAASPSQQEGDAVFRSKLHVLELALHDDIREDLMWFFYQVIEFIDNARRSAAGKVLIHCHQGISRSCAFAVAYVMYQQQQSHHAQHKHLGFREALAFVKSKRPIASPNTAFLCQLIAWEQELASFSAFSQDTPPRNVLYRLAPHAAHDPETLVLKACRYASASQQLPVVVTYDAGSWRPIVWSRGIFVFRSSPQEVTIWKGHACDIVDGAAEARRHVEHMICVRLSCFSRGDANGQKSAALHGINIVEIDEAPENGNAAQDCDHFGYADELTWMQTRIPGPSSTIFITPSGNGPDSETHRREVAAELAALKVQSEKPLLFVLDSIDDDGNRSWDHVTEYDSEDLTTGDAFLLYVPSLEPASCSHYLWIRSACVVAEDALIKLVMLQIMNVQGRVFSDCTTRISAAPVIERESEESEQFWSAFERGY